MEKIILRTIFNDLAISNANFQLIAKKINKLSARNRSLSKGLLLANFAILALGYISFKHLIEIERLKNNVKELKGDDNIPEEKAE